MTAYAIAHLRNPQPHPEIIEYIERIQATMDPYQGRFLVHRKEAEVKEGPFPGALVVIGFPDMDSARGWYDSDAYQEILPLRTRNIDGWAILVEGNAPGYDATATAAELRLLAAEA